MADLYSISNDAADSYKEFDVTAAVQADLNTSSDRSQFRLYHPEDWGLSDNYYSTWAMGNHGTYPAQLVITYPAP